MPGPPEQLISAADALAVPGAGQPLPRLPVPTLPLQLLPCRLSAPQTTQPNCRHGLDLPPSQPVAKTGAELLWATYTHLYSAVPYLVT